MALIRSGGYQTLLWENFSKGVHLRRSPAELDPPYLPLAINMTGRGRAAVQRFGTTLRGIPTATAQYVYHSPINPTLIYLQEGASLYKYTLSPFMGGRTLVKTFTTSATVHMADFIFGAGAGTRGHLIVHPVDGLWGYSGTALSGPFNGTSGAAMKGTGIAVWQNKAWIIDGSRIRWSNAGRGDLWTDTTDFADVREKDDEPLTAIGVGNGMDIAGRGGLHVFKRESAYVVIDSTTGEFITLDAYRGAENQEAVTSGAGGIYCANNVGIYRVTDGGLVEIHEPISPVWDDPNVGFRRTAAWSYTDRIYFSPATMGYIFEYAPETEAWWVHALNRNGVERGVLSATSTADATSGFSQPRPYLLEAAGDRVLDMWDDVNGHAYASAIEMRDYAPGAAGGGGPYPVTGKLRLPWVELGGDDFRVERAVVRGWGGSASGTAVTPSVYRNYKTGGPIVRSNITLGGSALGETRKQLHSLGVQQAFQLELAASPTEGDSFPNPDPDNSIPVQIPGFGVSLVRLDMVGLRG